MATGQGTAKGTTAHTEADGHGKAGFPPFQKETFASQLVSFAIAFALLYFIVSKFALPRVGGIIANREGVIENDLAEAQKLKDESDQALKAYETELADARARAQAIGSETRDKLNAQAESDRKALEAALAAKLADAEKTIASTRATAMGNVRSIASDAATAIVQRLTGVAPDSKTVDSAVDASLKG
ncbi:MAG: F0F1 ATP synthase subunit B' [Bradyrhizobiaceae bacterium]|jgi:F-type H+-transporting ATPase subunit b|uniref:ATP synthase subunit b n=1 Tax=Afipia broomeae ATCC 49717 TaxID=883078 RepID=K8P3P1_9BRAD|nr:MULTISPECIES: ATP synthase subunit B' [Afipia]MAH69389.1 F0F1 ATP synthase subunit B' [Afipia sp.]OUX61384.1 MAG: F0F1 ATP synthase subunit B' [Afipia sp. TMED4]RTL83750.1 MAG: F0F1 ATP synthase subunit B' [Bradyrhizobiaceae bacterium]EKS34275.1 ATP synthase subunit B' [Afipia broomeae ATCC 49717]HAO39361.1 F0F1 ATP synthase subunit B' [Afipia sp.]